ncbi:probable L-ascorbate peroxidase 6, chloroplastic/mitochondrial isoform X1 [Tanacetum coccineum]
MALSGTTTTSARFLPLSPPTTTNSSTAKPSSLSFHSLSSSTSLSLRLSSHTRGLKTVNVSGGKLGTVVTTKCFASDPAQLKTAREDIKELLKTTFCHPILQLTPSAVELEERFQKHRQIKLIYDAIVRLGWHDAGTYNKNIEEWPQRGLVNALKLLQPIKDKYTGVTYADLFQLASATAVEEAGGPKIPMKYGRVDVSGPEQCPEEGRLPDAGPPSPADHLRAVFYRMGLSDKDIVALSGAHTLGRSRPERSGWGKPETKYTKEGPGAPGGQSWTVKWLRFDNSYFKVIQYLRGEKYAEDEKAFFTDYAEAHAKLSNLGAKFDPAEGFSIDDEPAAPVGEKFVAAKYSSGKRELSDAMKQKIRSEYVGFGGSPDKPLQSNYFLNIIIVIAVLAILTSLVGN